MKPIKTRSENRRTLLLYNVGYAINVFFLAASFALTLFSDKFLPSIYRRDSTYISLRISSLVTGYTDSFQTVVKLYGFFGIHEITIIVRILQWLIFFFAFQAALKMLPKNQSTVIGSVITFFYFMLIPFYGAVLTKEVFMALCLLTYFAIVKFLIARQWLGCSQDRLGGVIPILLLTLTLGLFFRNYYLVIGLLFIIYYTLNKYLSKLFLRIILPILTLTIASTFDNIFSLTSRVLGFNIFNIRIITQQSLDIVANSTIHQNYLDGSLINNLLIYSQVWLQMFLPIRLINDSIYSLFTFFISTSILLLISLPFIFSKMYRSVHSTLLYAYLSASLIFEPDLGSFVRHSFVFLSVALLVWNDANTYSENIKG